MTRVALIKQAKIVLGRRRNIFIVAAVVALIIVSGTAIALTRNDKPQQQATPRVKNTGQTKKPVPANKTTPAASTQATTSPTTPQSTSSTKASTPASSERYLIISPTTFTMAPGQQPTITVSSNNGKSIHMPGFKNRPAGFLFFNFAAGPAKPTWNGPLMAPSAMQTGTYTYEIQAQDTTTATYYGTITVTFVQPTLNISATYLGYDEDSDVIGYRINLERLYGFSEQVTSVSARSNTEPSLACDAEAIDNNSIELVCGPESDPRPTSGTLTITVATTGTSRTITTPYTLPAL